MRVWVILAGGWLASCGGGGASAPPALEIVRTMPVDGSDDFAPESELSVTFSASLDASTLTLETVLLLRTDGTQVPALLITEPLNPRNVSIRPEFGLVSDTRYRLVVKGSVRSVDGVPLGADHEICFYTSGEPTVREEQILDLGDRLNVPRYLAQTVRIGSRVFVIGGYRSATEATDAIEEWNPATRSFDLLPVKLLGPRAEFTVTSLRNGIFLITGGVDAPGGVSLRTTEILDPASGSSPGPPLIWARRQHAACPFRAGGVLVSGGIGALEKPLNSLEYYEDGSWHLHPGKLGAPAAQHIQLLNATDDVYVTGGNSEMLAASVDSTQVNSFHDGEARFRAEGRVVDGRALVVGGDARSVMIHGFNQAFSWPGSDLLRDRRRAFSLTEWGSSGRLFLAAGGFQITVDDRTLRSLELVEYLSNAGGRPDAIVHTVTASELPVPFAGHVGFNDPGGATVLAGGIADGVGDHSRRVVMILDDRSSPPPTCK